jgi:hypothetical protein
LIVLNVVLHIIGLALINDSVVPVLSGAMERVDHSRRDNNSGEPLVKFHRIAKEAIRRGVKEKRFKSGEQWEVLRREEGAVIVTKRQR